MRLSSGGVSLRARGPGPPSASARHAQQQHAHARAGVALRSRLAPVVAAAASSQQDKQQHQQGATTSNSTNSVRVRFRVVRRVAFGERLAVVGAAPELGGWDVAAAPRLRWSEGHEWRAVVEFKGEATTTSSSSSNGNRNGDGDSADDQDDDDDDDLPFFYGGPSATEYKFVVVKDEGGSSSSSDARWESGENRVLDVAGLFPGPGMAVDVAVGDNNGGDHQPAEAVASVVPLSELEGTPLAAAGKHQGKSSKKQEDKGRHNHNHEHEQQQQHQSPPVSASSSTATTDLMADAEGRVGVGAAGWLGKDVSFMTSNDHSSGRPAAATWQVPAGLSDGHPAAALIKGDKGAPSWLEKLRVAQRVLVDSAPRQRPRLSAVAHAYAYLQWVATGAVPCAEGGGHFRPNHHARAAQAVFRSLEWAIEEDAAEAAAAARREQSGGYHAAHGDDADEAGDEGYASATTTSSSSSADEEDDSAEATGSHNHRRRLPPRLRTLLARRLSTKLPSFGEQFTQTVPLTRIRDIAHRGDIPHGLKQEIKHTLQNKLHRNAGPEDLVAAEAMLARLDADGGERAYSPPFLSEFRIFVAELREFFGAASLAALLKEGIRPSLAGGGSGSGNGDDDDSVRALDHFLARKRDLDDKREGASLDDVVGVAHALVTVRALLLGGLASGMRNDAPDGAAAMRQKWRLAETRADDYLFVLLARVVGGMLAAGGGGGGGGGSASSDDASGGAFLAAADTLARGSDRAWAAPLGAAVLALRSLALSGWQPAECAAVERELASWQDQGGVAENRDGSAARLRATLDRAQRLCADYTDAMLAVLPAAASRMGPALGVPQHAIDTFAEAEVRASVAFQLSRLLALLQRAARVAVAASSAGGVAALSEWEPIVAGTARGVLVDVPSLESDAARRAIADAAAKGTGVVMLLREATGDEELASGGGGGSSSSSSPSSRPTLRGIALAQPLPHLSHLGVRARQERVPLATISPSALAREVLPLVGKAVELRVGSDGSTVELRLLKEGELAAATTKATTKTKTAASSATLPPLDADRSQALEVVALPDARAETCGAKAASCARLLRLSAEGGGAASASASASASAPAPFRAPRGAVLPFGAMEAAADAAGVRAKYDALLDRADDLSAGAATGDPAALAQLDAVCAELRRLVSALRPSAAALSRVFAAFGGEASASSSSSPPPPTPTHLIARSSANVEDLAGLSGAGLYDSVPNVPFASAASSAVGAGDDLGAAVARVWASLHTRRAVLARRAAGVPQRAAAMAVLVQEQLSPDVSFVLHTRSPVVLVGGGGSGGGPSSSSSSLALAELAPGLGETLAGASKGSGWRLLLDKPKGELAATLAFANFSDALVPPKGAASAAASAAAAAPRAPLAEALYAKAGGRISGDVVEVPSSSSSSPSPSPPSGTAAAATSGRTYALARRPVDYSRQRLSASAEARKALGAELARVSAALEAEFGGEAQDAEGCVLGFNEGGGYQVYVVQSRPQPPE